MNIKNILSLKTFSLVMDLILTAVVLAADAAIFKAGGKVVLPFLLIQTIFGYMLGTRLQDWFRNKLQKMDEETKEILSGALNKARSDLEGFVANFKTYRDMTDKEIADLEAQVAKLTGNKTSPGAN